MTINDFFSYSNDDGSVRVYEWVELQENINKLFEEFATVALAQFDAKTRFEIKASRGSVEKGLQILDKLDKEL